MRTLAIGDVHGCLRSLDTVLGAIRVEVGDFLIFLGDYIDRGPASKGVIARIIELGLKQKIVTLRGNHEVMILSARTDALQSKLWRSYGGDEALHSYGAGYNDDWQRFIPHDHWEFFESTRPWFETETHIFVHATVLPDLKLTEQPDYALYWERFDMHLRHQTGKTVICGHTPQRSGLPFRGEHCVCIDTGANSGGWLTCLDVVSGNFWQANELGAQRRGKL